ncbi:MAG: threonylcarbamoyl-AMP synthase [Cytophagia bacterium]|nr:threonylcarbamoyl-AMP synthase [Cytophagia bacterium]
MAEIGKDIAKAKALLKKGKLVAIPTETVYGLAANATNADAVARIFEAKNRPSFDPLIVHVPDLHAVKRYADNLPLKALALASAFWPGPVTILFKKKDIIPDIVTSGLDTVGIRCPNHPITRALLEELDFPLAAPSANPFGYISPTTPEHVNEQLGDKIAYILDGGPCTIGIESTIVGFHNDQATVYRLGGLGIEEIEKVIGTVGIMLHSSSNPQAPGQLKSHYAPSRRLIIGNLDQALSGEVNPNVAVLSFQKDYKVQYQFILSSAGDLTEAAKNLFLGLRTLDKMPVDAILTDLVPEQGLGRAINDRLRRAAAEQ